MALTLEWNARVEAWLATLREIFFEPVCEIPLSGAFTFDRLRPEEAGGLEFHPMPAGTPWGEQWQYAWFRGSTMIPAECAERPLVLEIGSLTPQWDAAEPYGEWRVFLNGVEVGSRDWAHVHLEVNAPAGESLDFLAEAFGGPSRSGAGGGPALPGRSPILKVTGPQRILPPVRLGIWNEEAFQLWHDAATLFDLRKTLHPDSLRLDEIDGGLREFTLIADFEVGPAQRDSTLAAARRRLAPLLACHNGSTAPVLYCTGHSHIDVVYQWPFAETQRKVARTFCNQLALLERYPEYHYLQSMPVLYEVAKRLYPGIYEKVKAAVAGGRWIAEGALWTEADSNLPSGESLIRQILHGKRFFREEFGVESRLAWLPDIFGCSGALPQIFRGCGIDWFASGKIFGLYNGGEPFPYTSFVWEGIDGSRILSHFVEHYGSGTQPGELIAQWQNRPQKSGVKARQIYYGHSDGGGGCERSHLEFLRRCSDLEGMPRTIHCGPQTFFEKLESEREGLPVYNGEIYFPLHRGTYTTQARLKQLNRRCEYLLREAEIWTALAAWRGADIAVKEDLERAWKKVLFNQFHDILPGSCIQRAAEEARAELEEAAGHAQSVAARAMETFTAGPTGASVFNSLPFRRFEIVPGSGPDSQRVNGRECVEVECAPLSASPIRAVSRPDRLECTTSRLENSLLAATIDATGRVVQVIDKTSGVALLRAPGNDLRIYRDTPRRCEAWDIDSHWELQPVTLDEKASIEVTAEGPLFAELTIRRELLRSTLEQRIRLRRHSRVLEFQTRIDWRERHKLLKVAFPFDIHSTEALHEIQFGHIARPTHRSRQIDQDRFEVCQHTWSALREENRGVAILNDAKYGISTHQNSLDLTLLRAPLAPDDQADLGTHEFTYALYFWNGPFVASGLAEAAACLNMPVKVCPGLVGEPSSFFQVTAPNVVLETVKLAEDGSGDLILRLYEWARSRTRTDLTCALEISEASECDMLERRTLHACEVSLLEGGCSRLPLTFRAFEIKTLRLRRRA